jgi:hypothetical protein
MMVANGSSHIYMKIKKIKTDLNVLQEYRPAGALKQKHAGLQEYRPAGA